MPMPSQSVLDDLRLKQAGYDPATLSAPDRTKRLSEMNAKIDAIMLKEQQDEAADKLTESQDKSIDARDVAVEGQTSRAEESRSRQGLPSTDKEERQATKSVANDTLSVPTTAFTQKDEEPKSRQMGLYGLPAPLPMEDFGKKKTVLEGLSTALSPQVSIGNGEDSREGLTFDQARVGGMSEADRTAELKRRKTIDAFGKGIDAMRSTIEHSPPVGWKDMPQSQKDQIIKDQVSGIQDVLTGNWKGKYVQDEGLTSIGPADFIQKFGVERTIGSKPTSTTGNIPALTPDQLAFIDAYNRGGELGGLPWWASTKGSYERLIEQKGTGTRGGVTEYPSGATAETPGAHIMRLISGPANFAEGAGAAVVGKVLPSYAAQREKSPYGPVSQGDSVLMSGLDSVSQNRGLGAETADFSIYALDKAGVTDPVTRSRWTSAGMIGGLAGDIMFVDIVPGAGLVLGAEKGLTEVSRLSKLSEGLPDAVKLTKGEKLAIVGRAALNDWSPTLAKMLKVDPDDFRLLYAKSLADYSIGRAMLEDSKVSGKAIDLNDIAHATGKKSTLYLNAERAASNGKWDEFVQSMTTALPKESEEAYQAYARGVRSLEDVASGGQVSRDMAKWLSIASTDPKFMESIAGKGVRASIEKAMSEPVLRGKLLSVASQDISTYASIRKGLGDLPKDMVMVTPNTAVKGSAARNAILQEAKTSTLGLAIRDALSGKGAIKSGFIEDAAGITTRQSTVAIPAAIRRRIQEAIADITRQSTTNVTSHRNLISLFDAETVPLSALRQLQDINVDAIARRGISEMGSRGVVSVSSQEIQKLGQTARKEVLKPIEVKRGRIQRAMQDMYEKYRPTVTPNLSVRAQVTLDAARRELATVPANLSNRLKELRLDPSVRQAYGVTEGRVLSDSEAFSLLIVGPVKNRSRGMQELVSQLNDIILDARRQKVTLDTFFNSTSYSFSTVEKISLAERISEDTAGNKIHVGEANTVGTGSSTFGNLVYNAGRRTIASLETETDIASQLIATLSAHMDEMDRIVASNPNAGLRAIKSKDIEFALSGLYMERAKQKIAREAMQKLTRNENIKWLPAGVTNFPVGSNAFHVINSAIGIRLWELVNGSAHGLPSVMTEEGLRRILNDAVTKTVTDASGDQHVMDVIGTNRIDTEAIIASLNRSKQPIGSFMAAFGQYIDEMAEEIRRIHGLTMTNHGDVIGAIESIVNKEDMKPWNMILGADTVEFIAKNLDTSSDMAEFKKLVDILHAPTQSTVKMAHYFSQGLETLKAWRFNMMLTMRARFHGPNIITAPLLMASTLGGLTTAQSLMHWPNAARALAYDAYRGSTGHMASFMQNIAVTDKAGRAYTYDDILRLSREAGALRSQTSVVTSVGGINDIKNAAFPPKTTYDALGLERLITDEGGAQNVTWLQNIIDRLVGNTRPVQLGKEISGQVKPVISDLTRSSQLLKDWTRLGVNAPAAVIPVLKDFAESCDQTFRLSSIMSSLASGEDMSVALQKGRRSLFDYGELSDFEREWVSRYVIFWSFARNSYATFLKDMVANPTRIKNAVRIVGAGDWTSSEKQYTSIFAPDYMLGRMKLGTTVGVDKSSYMTVGPGVPLVDSTVSILSVLAPFDSRSKLKQAQDAIGLVLKNADPMVNQIFVAAGAEEKEDWSVARITKTGEIEPVDVAYLKATGQWDNFLNYVTDGHPELMHTKPASTGETTFEANRDNPGGPGLLYTFADDSTLYSPVSDNARRCTAKYAQMKWWISQSGAATLLKDYAPMTAQFQGSGFVSGKDMSSSLPEMLGVTSQVSWKDPNIARQKAAEADARLRALQKEKETEYQ